jgi:Ca-activated chloride channel homolog
MNLVKHTHAPRERATPHAVRALALALLVLLLPGSGPRAHAQEGAGAVATSSPARVALTVTVTDPEGRPVTGLGRDAFAVYENKSEREVASFEAGAAPLSVGIVFDMSDSVSYSADVLDEARRALLAFAQRGDGSSEYFVMGFNKTSRLLADWTRDASAVGAGLNALPSLQRKGSRRTALLDALYEGLKKLGGGSNPKRVLLVVSDGEDNDSRRKLSEVRRLAAESGALVYAVAVSHGDDSVLVAPRWRSLEELCAASGGRAFHVESYLIMVGARRAGVDPLRDVRRAVEAIDVELRSQYTLGFLPSAPAGAAEWRRVTVRLKPQNKSAKASRARTREGYLSAAAPR